MEHKIITLLNNKTNGAKRNKISFNINKISNPSLLAKFKTMSVKNHFIFRQNYGYFSIKDYGISPLPDNRGDKRFESCLCPLVIKFLSSPCLTLYDLSWATYRQIVLWTVETAWRRKCMWINILNKTKVLWYCVKVKVFCCSSLYRASSRL